MELSGEMRATGEPSTTEEDHQVNQVLSKLSPAMLAVALLLILLGSVLQLQPVLADGVAVLIAIPILSVTVSVVTFARQHDYRFALVGLAVLAVIVASALTGLH